MEGYRADWYDEDGALIPSRIIAEVERLTRERDYALRDAELARERADRNHGAVDRAEKAEAEAARLRGIIERRGTVEQLAQLDRLDGGR